MKTKFQVKNALLPTLFTAIVALGSCQHKTTEPSASALNLEEITLETLQKGMESGQFTARSIAQVYLQRIADLDKKGPALNSIIEINPDALAIADALDAERKAGKIRGPLHGIPVLIKDNIDTGDKMQTTAGALAMVGNVAQKDAFIIQQLRAAGAVILGKTNLSEWANFRSTRSASGWSSRGGQTKNPYILDRSPCGSSSGSGVAVSANLCAVAIGTETDGSIACPASVNGIVGIKPTVGLLSRSGIIPISKSQDTAGPFGRTVHDAAVLLGALTGVDTNDPATAASAGKIKADYTQFLDKNALKGKRIGIEKSYLKHHEGVDALLQKALEQLKAQGATIVEIEYLDALQKNGDAELTVLKYEFKDGLNQYLAAAHAPVKSLQDVINFNLKNEAQAMPFFKQEILESCQLLGDLNSKEYQTALVQSQQGTRNVLDNVLKKHQLDAICGPSTGASWCTDLVNGDLWPGYGAYTPAAVAGYPSVTVPMGMVSGLPVGLCFFGKAWDEPALIGIGYAYEQASKNRAAPKYLNTLDLNH